MLATVLGAVGAAWGVCATAVWECKALMIFSCALICVSCCAHFLLSSSASRSKASDVASELQHSFFSPLLTFEQIFETFWDNCLDFVYQVKTHCVAQSYNTSDHHVRA